MANVRVNTGRADKNVVYGLYDPRTGELRYVGKTECGIKKRLAVHMHEYSKHSHVSNWIRSLKHDGLQPSITILDTCLFPDMLCDLERAWIARMRRGGARLTNLTDGGEGVSGFRLTMEMRAKIASAKRASKTNRQHLRDIGIARQRPVIDQDGKWYASSVAAGRAIGASGPNVRRSITWKIAVLAGGFGFRYADDMYPTWTTRSEWEALVVLRRKRTNSEHADRARRTHTGSLRAPAATVKTALACRKPVIDQFGTMYESVAAAAKTIGVSATTVSSVLSGRCKSVKGFTLKLCQVRALTPGWARRKARRALALGEEREAA